MKKSLLAVAAMTAFAGAAQAQSSVTVYGLLDVGYTGGNARAQTSSTVVKESVSRISNSMESGSRLGFRGNEDLGGGTSAIFTFELGIQPAGNAGSNTTGLGTAAVTAGTATWAPNVRQAFVGFEKKGMGNARIGTQNTLFWEQAGSNTTGQLAQTYGSMLAPSTDGAFFTSSSNATSAGSTSAAYTARTTNTVRVATERMAGLIGKAAYTQSNSNSTAAGTAGYIGAENTQTGYQFALDYVFQKANIQASYASFSSDNPYNSTTLTTTNTVYWGSGTQGNNVKDNQALITASYDFGILKAYAGWTNRKVESSLNSNAFIKRTAQEVGVRSFITPTIEGWASIGNGRFSAFGTDQPTANIAGYQAGANYWLSKRTNLYAIYGQNNTSSTSNGAYNLQQYSIGARHTF
ncbi:porin [Polynucleobacter sp. 73C-SIWE]|uniref:porin n=1 Tax=Polynucleobacter sp. 73C-SIWE TaxID=2689098 RepID=UPI001C0B41A4|nr:porin [Polynucleobacter sp. 73C-SIWE]MBU3578863.1 porin [Polynucleobacter sp. 73C-SIWE]